MKILFITSNRVGDAVLSTGILAYLVKSYPGAGFTIASGPYSSGLFRAVPGLERVILINKRTWNRHWLGVWHACVGTDWDIIVDLRNSLVSRFLKSKHLFCLGKKKNVHKVIELGHVIKIAPAPSPHIWLDKKSTEDAQILLKSGPFLALGPAANWPPKQWPIERFAAFAAQCTAEDGLMPNGKVVVIAETQERKHLLPLLNSIPGARRIEIIGKDLLTVAACLKECALFVGNDSGLMHLAAAMGTKTLGLFGPGYEEIYGPWGENSAYVRTPESREALLSRLPNIHAREPNLMSGLEVKTVYDAAAKLLNI